MKIADLFEQEFTFNKSRVERLWKEINDVCFDGELHKPMILIEEDLNHLVPSSWKDTDKDGQCLGYCDLDPDPEDNPHDIVLLFSHKIDNAKELVEVVAHEMVHQALAEKHGYRGMLKIGHGSEFMAYKDAVKKYHNTTLHGASF